MVTASEALLSDDPEIIKRFKRSSKLQILCNVNILQNALSNKTEEGFVFGKINSQLIRAHKTKLEDNFKLIQDLHKRYIEACVNNLDAVEENKLLQDEIKFLEDINSKVFTVLEEISQYEDDLVSLNEIKELIKNEKETRCTVQRAKKEFNLIYEKIKTEISDIDTKE